jgi:hypothetical protein
LMVSGTSKHFEVALDDFEPLLTSYVCCWSPDLRIDSGRNF